MLENKKEKHKICTRTSCIQIPFFSLIVSFLFFVGNLVTERCLSGESDTLRGWREWGRNLPFSDYFTRKIYSEEKKKQLFVPDPISRPSQEVWNGARFGPRVGLEFSSGGRGIGWCSVAVAQDETRSAHRRRRPELYTATALYTWHYFAAAPLVTGRTNEQLPTQSPSL